MKKVILGFLASIGFLAILLAVGIYYSLKSLPTLLEEKEKEQVTDTTVLVLKVGKVPFIDVNQNRDIFSILQGYVPSLFDTVVAIKNAAQDERIKGILINIQGDNISLTDAQELKEALEIFRKSEKPIYAFSYSFGEGGNGTSPYYLALSADKIYMQPQGMLSVNGYAIESYFFRDLLDKHKVVPQLDRREGYKGVIEPFTNSNFSPETKENLQTLLNGMFEQVQDAIAMRFSLKKDQVKTIIDKAPYLDSEAIKEKLLTDLSHYEQVKDLFKKELKETPSFVSLKTYRKAIKPEPSLHKVALIAVQDEIGAPVSSQPYTDKDSPSDIARKLRKAGTDEKIEAIILRVDSPGGTVTGAETIWHEVDHIANTLKKPVVVSMGSLAASAGYMISAPATKIVANQGTITGSIGVASGKIAIGKAVAEYGINIQQILTTKNAGMWSAGQEFSLEEWTKIQQSLDHIYDEFLNKVSVGRNLSVEAVRKIAKGQVWTGQKAKELGLVDELGGFLKAISVTKELLNIPDETKVEIILSDDTRLTGGLFANFFEGMETLRLIGNGIKTVFNEKAQTQSKLSFEVK